MQELTRFVFIIVFPGVLWIKNWRQVSSIFIISVARWHNKTPVTDLNLALTGWETTVPCKEPFHLQDTDEKTSDKSESVIKSIGEGQGGHRAIYWFDKMSDMSHGRIQCCNVCDWDF